MHVKQLYIVAVEFYWGFSYAEGRLYLDSKGQVV